jgi:hypothetical protein
MTRSSILKKMIGYLPLLAFGSCSLAWGQVAPAATSGSGLNAFVSFGGQRTHVIDFTYNALGVAGGLFLQRSPLFGIEVRAATFPIHARYAQAPITAGYRLEGRVKRRFLVSGYVGGGMSKAQDAGPHYVPLAAQWVPCWQASQATALDTGRLKWQVYEVTFTDAYTPLRSLPGYSVTTGVVYSF